MKSILEGFALFGLWCMFLADNRGLWQRPSSWEANDEGYREIRTGK